MSFITFRRMPAASPVVAMLLLAGCASSPVSPGFDQVESAIADRTGQTVQWRQDAAAREAETGRLLGNAPLGIDTAVKVALLNDRTLQARFETLGIAAADLQQAGLPANPVLGAGIGLSNLSGTVPQISLDLMASIGEWLTRSARRDIAASELESVRMELASLVIDRIAAVQRAYYALLGARQIAALRREIDEAAAARHALAQRYFAAGNLSDLDLAREAGDRELAAVERLRADGDEAVAASRLQQAMGLADRPIDWQVPDQLPALPAQDPPMQALIAQATDRPDLVAARQRLDAQVGAEALARKWRYLGTLEGGVGGVRETDGERVIGPRLQIALPFFDRNDAGIARQSSRRRQAVATLEALQQQVRAEIDEQRLTLDARRRTARRYLDGVIPAHERIVEIGQRYNNYMLLGVFELLAARQAEYAVYQGYLESVRDYWLARVELQRALGGRAIDGPLPDGMVSLPQAVAPSMPHPLAPDAAATPAHGGDMPVHHHEMHDAPASAPSAGEATPAHDHH